MFEDFKLKRSFAKSASEIKQKADSGTLTIPEIEVFASLAVRTLGARPAGNNTRHKIALKTQKTVDFLVTSFDKYALPNGFSKEDRLRVAIVLMGISTMSQAEINSRLTRQSTNEVGRLLG